MVYPSYRCCPSSKVHKTDHPSSLPEELVARQLPLSSLWEQQLQTEEEEEALFVPKQQAEEKPFSQKLATGVAANQMVESLEAD